MVTTLLTVLAAAWGAVFALAALLVIWSLFPSDEEEEPEGRHPWDLYPCEEHPPLKRTVRRRGSCQANHRRVK